MVAAGDIIGKIDSSVKTFQVEINCEITTAGKAVCIVAGDIRTHRGSAVIADYMVGPHIRVHHFVDFRPLTRNEEGEESRQYALLIAVRVVMDGQASH